jgi:hypothetical protein
MPRRRGCTGGVLTLGPLDPLPEGPRLDAPGSGRRGGLHAPPDEGHDRPVVTGRHRFARELSCFVLERTTGRRFRRLAIRTYRASPVPGLFGSLGDRNPLRDRPPIRIIYPVSTGDCPGSTLLETSASGRLGMRLWTAIGVMNHRASWGARVWAANSSLRRPGPAADRSRPPRRLDRALIPPVVGCVDRRHLACRFAQSVRRHGPGRATRRPLPTDPGA